MDIGELENPYTYDKSGSTSTQTGTSGPLRIGDYDDKVSNTKQQEKNTQKCNKDHSIEQQKDEAKK